jgi:Uma2 family endonuclease
MVGQGNLRGMTSMSTVTAPPHHELTPDDVLAMPGDVLYELVDGRLVEVNVGAISSRVAGNITKLLMIHCDSPLIAHVFPEHGYTCFPGKRNRMRRPDVSLVLAERMTPELFAEGFTPVRPDLAVEVISPNDIASDLGEKLDDYYAAGIPLIWIVYPEARRVHVFRWDGPPALLGPDDELTGEDILPGFRCRVADFFSGLPATVRDEDGPQ